MFRRFRELSKERAIAKLCDRPVSRFRSVNFGMKGIPLGILFFLALSSFYVIKRSLALVATVVWSGNEWEAFEVFNPISFSFQRQWDREQEAKKKILLAHKKMGEDSFINVWTTLAGVLIIFTLDWVWPPTPLCPLHKLGTAQCCSIKLALCSTQVAKERGTTIDWTTHKSTTKHKVSQKSVF